MHILWLLKLKKIYAENPEGYDNAGQIKTGKIVALIAVILNVLVMIRWIYVFATGGMEAIQEAWSQIQEGMDAAQ